MEEVIFDIDNTQVQMAMVMKLQQLIREELSTLTYQNLESYLAGYLWQRRSPRNLSQAVNDVWNVHANEIVQYLSLQAMKNRNKETLGELADLIGGNQYEE